MELAALAKETGFDITVCHYPPGTSTSPPHSLHRGYPTAWSTRVETCERSYAVVRIEGETLILRPPEVVFDFLADETNEPRYNPRIVRSRLLSSGPIGKGTKFLACFRSAGHMAPALIEYLDYRKPERLVSVTRMRWADVRGELGLVPAPSGTRLQWSSDLRPAGFARLLTPVLTFVARRQEKSTWANMKRLLEAGEHQTLTK